MHYLFDTSFKPYPNTGHLYFGAWHLIDVKTRHSPGETYLQIESNTKKSYKIAESFINPLLQLKVIIRPFPYH